MVLKTPSKPYRLIDSAQMATDNPDSWSHAPQEALDKIALRHYVMIGVHAPNGNTGGERFWTIVREIQIVKQEYMVEINQDLRNGRWHGLADKDRLVVHQRNIFGVLAEDASTVLWEAPGRTEAHRRYQRRMGASFS